MKISKKSIILSFVSWLVCIILFFLITAYTVGVRGELYNETSNFIAYACIGILALGVLSFITGVFFLVLYKLNGNQQKLSLIKTFIGLAIMPLAPFYLFLSSIKGLLTKKDSVSSRLAFLAASVFTIPIWLFGYFLCYKTIQEFTGLGYDFIEVRDSSSMSPSIPAGSGYKSYRYKNIWHKLDQSNIYQFQRGDIVSFSNQKSKELIATHGLDNFNFFKRIIALPGEEVMIAGGLLFVNGKPLEEPYTLEENNTFTGDIIDEDGIVIWQAFFQECEKVIVPENSLFVLGDNRAHSDDSRIIGFVNFDDVVGYLHINEQKEEYCHGSNCFKHDKEWREVSEFEESGIERILKQCDNLI